jgi:hypothetical protein
MISSFTIILIIAGVSFCIATGAPEIGPGFELSQSAGPVDVKYGPSMPYQKFLSQVNLNTQFCYVGGSWDLERPIGVGCTPLLTNDDGFIQGKVFVNGNLIDLYTNNHMYPLLKDQSLPLTKTFLGNFNVGFSIDTDRETYLRHFSEGTLDVYRLNSSKFVEFENTGLSELAEAFLGWYYSWSSIPEFDIYKPFFFPINRSFPNWVHLLQFTKDSYLHPSMVPVGDSWVAFSQPYRFSTIDFFESASRVTLSNFDNQLGLLSPEEAMFRYYDIETGKIGFWTPADLVLANETKNIADLINRNHHEVLAVFSNWATGLGSGYDLYFNYVSNESFDWINDPQYSIGYVF